MSNTMGTMKQVTPAGDGDDVTPMVIRDLEDRMKAGEARYGTRLKTNNGRNALIDAYQEALDLCVYLRQKLAEDGWTDENVAEFDWRPENDGLVPHTNDRE